VTIEVNGLWLAVVIVVALGVAIATAKWVASSSQDHARTERASTGRGRTIASVDRVSATRRATRISGRPESLLRPLDVVGMNGANENVETFRAAFQLMVRGIDVQLIKYDYDAMPARRYIHRTETLAPFIDRIDSLDDFQKYVPFSPVYGLALEVHPDDEEDAYEILREVGIRLSALHHPDQHWWKDEDE